MDQFPVGEVDQFPSGASSSGGDEFELVISGLTATTKEWRLSIAGDLASATGREEYTFVARRR